ncbi:MinD/ParA family protein [Micromonospora echinospora]|uniref:MinD/ParA family ATP-binding protein n=1 Tax=Micromonospora echinospora TaxID=1877 RepID=UPI0036718B45
MTEYRQKPYPSLFRVAGRVAWRALDPRVAVRLRAERTRTATLSAPFAPGVVAVVGPDRGAGRSTVAALLALALARHQGSRVLAVETGPGGGLHRRLATRPGGSTTAVLTALGVRAGGAGARPGAVGRRWLREQLTLGEGPMLLAVDPATADRPLTDVEYAPATTALARWFPTCVVDTPPLTSDPVVPAVLTRADRVVIVLPDGPGHAQRSGRCRSWIAPLLPRPVEEVAVDVRVRRDGDAGPGWRRAAPVDDGALVLPDDPAVRDGGVLRWPLLAADTRYMILSLACRLVKEND